MNTNETIFVKHSSGALHEYKGRRAAKLRREIMAGRGGPEVTALTLNGYVGFLSDTGEIDDFEALNDYYARKFKTP